MKNVFFSLGVILFSVSGCAQNEKTQHNNPIPIEKRVVKTAEEWKELLTDVEYHVIREKGTERAFTGKYYNHHVEGVYVCKACKNPLFSSKTKFESGTGWPSFYQPIQTENVGELEDNSFGIKRIEVVCNFCGGHLGHVFNDGPEPTGLRYCINSVALNFKSISE